MAAWFGLLAAGTGAGCDAPPSALPGEEREREGKRKRRERRGREERRIYIPEYYWQLGLVYWQLELELVMVFLLQRKWGGREER